MAGHEPSGESIAHSSTYALATDIIRAAVAEASRIRLDAVKAGELMYGEIVKAAQSQAEGIVAEARQEAQRILAEAESQAMRQAETNRGSRAEEAALETLRLELASMVRQLRGSLGVGTSQLGIRSSASRPVDDTVVPDTPATAEPTIQSRLRPSRRPQSPDQLSPNGLDIRQDRPGHPESSDGGSWQPPEWMSSQN